jgi:hypothetical protein
MRATFADLHLARLHAMMSLQKFATPETRPGRRVFYFQTRLPTKQAVRDLLPVGIETHADKCDNRNASKHTLTETNCFETVCYLRSIHRILSPPLLFYQQSN